MEYFDEIQDRVILIGVQASFGDDMEAVSYTHLTLPTT